MFETLSTRVRLSDSRDRRVSSQGLRQVLVYLAGHSSGTGRPPRPGILKSKASRGAALITGKSMPPDPPELPGCWRKAVRPSSRFERRWLHPGERGPWTVAIRPLRAAVGTRSCVNTHARQVALDKDGSEDQARRRRAKIPLWRSCVPPDRPRKTDKRSDQKWKSAAIARVQPTTFWVGRGDYRIRCDYEFSMRLYPVASFGRHSRHHVLGQRGLRQSKASFLAERAENAP